MLRKLIIILLIFQVRLIFAQNFTGNVLDQNENPLQGVLVFWLSSTTGTSTNENGYFRLTRIPENKILVISYTGFANDSIEIPADELFTLIHLKEGVILNEVQIDANRSSNTFSRINPLNIEGLEEKEFKKAACCSLSESFQTSNAVDVSYSNAATGSKEIQFLGLRGLYTQLLIENRPAFNGILSQMGYDLIPGTWLNKVNIQKGASTSIYGAQSMAGAINVQLKSPHDDYPVYFNLFGDLHGRMEGNLHLNKKWSAKRASGLYLNGTYHNAGNDHNQDGFQDDPQINRINGMIRNTFFSNTWEGQLNAQMIYEKRNGGQLTPENPYLIHQEITHMNLSGNLGYVNFNKELQNAGSIYDIAYSKINSSYGGKPFIAEEKRVFAQLFYNHPLDEGKHQITLGPAFSYNKAKESFASLSADYDELVASLYMDYTYRDDLELNNRFTFTYSQRLEFIKGVQWLYIPRINVRYLFADDWTVRSSIGRGYRFSRLFSDNSSLLVTSKNWIIENKPELEKSWNMGLNVVGKPYLNGKEITLNLDMYYTFFTDQLVADLDYNYQNVTVYALQGSSYAFQTIITLEYPLLDRLKLKIGGKYTDSKTSYKKGLRQNLLVPEFRGLLSLDFESENRIWLWNVSGNYVGKMRLADKENVPHELIHEHSDFSKNYVLLQTQLNYTRDRLELYAGIENILNYTQHEAIIDPANPTGPYFNAAEVYAPVAGIKPYVGIKWRFIKKK
jgi:outer membrane receptor for ferrienterochelin and colicin